MTEHQILQKKGEEGKECNMAGFAFIKKQGKEWMIAKELNMKWKNVIP